MRVLVCGGRDYYDRETVWAVLNDQNKHGIIQCVIQGGARGADHLGRLWAEQHDVDVEEYAADWQKHGRRAGPIRNQRMIDEGKPNMVVAFPGGRGTADMIRRARLAGLPLIEVCLV